MHEHDPPSRAEPDLDEMLRHLRLPEPPATLRARTLDDAHDVLASNDRRAPSVPWRFAVAGAVLALCLWSMSWRDATAPSNYPTSMPRDAVAFAHWIDLEPNLARHLRARMNRPRPSRPYLSTPLSEGNRFHGRHAINADRL